MLKANLKFQDQSSLDSNDCHETTIGTGMLDVHSYRWREVLRGLSIDPAGKCREEAAPLQEAISPPPPHSWVLGWGQGLSGADLGLPLAAVFCDVTIMMRIDDRTRWFHCLRRQWRPRKNLAESACSGPGFILEPLNSFVTAPRPR